MNELVYVFAVFQKASCYIFIIDFPAFNFSECYPDLILDALTFYCILCNVQILYISGKATIGI